jgi:hypothetical protein
VNSSKMVVSVVAGFWIFPSLSHSR